MEQVVEAEVQQTPQDRYRLEEQEARAAEVGVAEAAELGQDSLVEAESAELAEL